MKFARFSGGRSALVVGSGKTVLDIVKSLGALDETSARQIADVLPGDGSGDWLTMIERWPQMRAAFQALERMGEAENRAVALNACDSVTLDAPLPSTERRIFALGANTVGHILGVTSQLPGTHLTLDDIFKPKNAGAAPIGFHVFPDSVIGPHAIVIPPSFVRKLDYEGECAVIVGHSEGRHTPTPIWGYTAWNDLGMRDGNLGLIPVMPSFGYSFNLWKNWDTANACGPWVCVDESRDIDNLRCEMLVNGEKRQDWNTSEMIYSFADLFGHLSQYMKLKAGDIATSGTGAGTALEGPVDGAQWLKPGDVMEVRLEGLGPLITTVGAW